MRLEQAPADADGRPRRAVGAEGLAAGIAALEEEEQPVRQGLGLAGTGLGCERQEALAELALVGLGEPAAGMVGLRELDQGVGHRAAAKAGLGRATAEPV